MSKNTDANLLSKEITKYLNEYAEDISEIVEKVANEVGKEAVGELKQISPKKSGEYAKSWGLRKDKVGKNRYVVKVHNKKYASLTHLLEFGHAKRNGGRTEAIAHIRPTEEKYSKIFEQTLKKEIGGIK